MFVPIIYTTFLSWKSWQQHVAVLMSRALFPYTEDFHLGLILTPRITNLKHGVKLASISPTIFELVVFAQVKECTR